MVTFQPVEAVWEVTAPELGSGVYRVLTRSAALSRAMSLGYELGVEVAELDREGRVIEKWPVPQAPHGGAPPAG